MRLAKYSRCSQNLAQRLALICSAIATLGLAGCNEDSFDIKTQIGANPVLPDPQQYLLPPMKIAKTTSWGNEVPTVAPGLRIEALARGLGHPRSIYVLPNGDVLVVEANGPPAPVNRPKDLVMGWVQSFAGSKAKGANQITLLRNVKDGKAEIRSVFLDNLNSPFGVALVGSDLYVANTDAIIRYPYHDGDTKISAPGVKLTDLPGGPIDHHWTKSLLASPDGSKLYAGVGSNSNITENGMQAEIERASIWEIDRATGAHRLFATGLRNPNGLQWEPQSGKLWAVVNERDELGPKPRSGLSDVGSRRRLLRLALQLLWTARRPAGDAAATRSGRESHTAGLRAKFSRGPTRDGVLHRHKFPVVLQGGCLCWRAWQLGSQSLQRVSRGLCAVQGWQARRTAPGCRNRLSEFKRRGARPACRTRG